MALHDFMLPEVIPFQPDLKDLAARDLPSPLFVGVDTRRSETLLKEGIFASGSLGKNIPPIDSGYKHVRRQALFDEPFKSIKGKYFVDLEDARLIPRGAVYGYDFNVFQYNRRRGDRSSILWRLRSYFEPSASLGHPPRSAPNDTIPFIDKVPQVFWRGSPTGSSWKNPYVRSGVPKIDPAHFDEDHFVNSNSRFTAVFSLTNKGFLNARFTGHKVDDFVASGEYGQFFDDHVPPSTIQKYRYVLCPAGNDVSSALYWIIRTNCLGFKEETEYEVLPDYFLQPWVHYVPISSGLIDLQEKFEYCENNPQVCAKIIENANLAYAKITSTEIWRAAENTVLERLDLL